MLANRKIHTLPRGEQDTLPLESQQGEVTWFLKPQHCMGAKLQGQRQRQLKDQGQHQEAGTLLGVAGLRAYLQLSSCLKHDNMS